MWAGLLAVHPATQALQFEGCSCRWTGRIFFPRARTPCGRCAQVIVVEREHNKMREKNTRKNSKNNKTNQPTKTQPETTKRPEADSPSYKQGFLCTEVRQVRRVDCILSKGLNSPRSLSKGKSERSLSKRLRSIIKTVTTRPLRRVVKHGQVAFRSGCIMTVSSTDSCQRKSVVAMPC